MFEIRTVKDYPVNYKQCTDIAAEEGRTNARPELRGTLPDGVYLTGFHSNFPTQADIDSIFSFLTEHTLQPLIGAHFAFRDIAQACTACDGGKVNGKIVVELQGAE